MNRGATTIAWLVLAAFVGSATAQSEKKGKKAAKSKAEPAVFKLDDSGYELSLSTLRQKGGPAKLRVQLRFGRGGERIAIEGSLQFEGATVDVAESSASSFDRVSNEYCRFTKEGVAFFSNGLSSSIKERDGRPSVDVAYVPVASKDSKEPSGDPRVLLTLSFRARGKVTTERRLYRISGNALVPETAPEGKPKAKKK